MAISKYIADEIRMQAWDGEFDKSHLIMRRVYIPFQRKKLSLCDNFLM